MSILLHGNTRVLVQGITSSFAARQSAGMIQYGTKIVAGVTPGKGGASAHGVPVYDTVAEATRDVPADASVIYVPADSVVDAVIESVDAGIRFVFVTAEGLPQKDMMYLRALTRESGCWLIGPNSLGIISAGQALMGSFPPEWATPGKVGLLSRGGTLLLHTSRQLKEAGIGISTAAHVGGDMVLARNPVEYLQAFEADPATSAVVLLSEVGGGKDHECAEFIRGMKKPVVAFVVGRSVPPGRAMGHAGALVGGANQTAAAKSDALQAAGARIARGPEDIPALVREALQSR
jgi:succinyl-CoA synthetase alpha subunit